MRRRAGSDSGLARAHRADRCDDSGPPPCSLTGETDAARPRGGCPDAGRPRRQRRDGAGRRAFPCPEGCRARAVGIRRSTTPADARRRPAHPQRGRGTRAGHPGAPRIQGSGAGVPRRHHHLQAMANTLEGTVTIELHHELMARTPFVRPRHYEDLARRSQRFDWDGLSLETLGCEDMLWHVAAGVVVPNAVRHHDVAALGLVSRYRPFRTSRGLRLASHHHPPPGVACGAPRKSQVAREPIDV